VLVMGMILVAITMAVVRRYSAYVSKPPQDIVQSEFGLVQRRVLSKEVPTGICDGVVHNVRTTMGCTSIFCGEKGDPYDSSQRTMVLHISLIVSLLVSMLLFNPGEAECKEVCDQAAQNGSVTCRQNCGEPQTSGLYATLLTAAITVPVTFTVEYFFKVLHAPVIGAVKVCTGPLHLRSCGLSALSVGFGAAATGCHEASHGSTGSDYAQACQADGGPAQSGRIYQQNRKADESGIATRPVHAYKWHVG
jgi:hypothetical protein